MKDITSGEWRVRYDDGKAVEIVCDPWDSQTSCCITQIVANTEPRHTVANARLMAHSPRMFAALDVIANFRVRPETEHRGLLAVCMRIAKAVVTDLEAKCESETV